MPCLWSHGHPRLRLSPCRALCGCCPGAGAGAGAGCAGRLSALSLCQPCPCPCPCLPLFPELSCSMAGLWRWLSGCSEDTQTFPHVLERQRPCPQLWNRCHAQGTQCCVQPQWGSQGQNLGVTWAGNNARLFVSVCVCLSAETLLLHWVMALTQEV